MGTDGQLAVSGGGGVSVTGSNSAEMTLTGPVSNIDSFFNTAATASDAVDEIRYTGLADDNGTAAVSLTIEADDGGFVGSGGGGGGGNTLLGTVQIDITAVNDEPSFVIRDSVDSSIDGRVSPAAAGGDQTVDDDAGGQTVEDWAVNFKPGPVTATDESGQGLRFDLSTSSTDKRYNS